MKNYRQKLLARIHMLVGEKGLEEETFRLMKTENIGPESCKDMDNGQLKTLLGLLNPRKTGYPGRPKNADSPDRGPLIGKIEAQLADLRLPWAYADGIAKKMFGIQKIAFCNPAQLKKIVAALTYHRQRKG
jgi:phage gp16-like protein